MTPSVGRIVHYVSYGTPGGEYTSQCRAAIIAGVIEIDELDLVVFNPTGLFFNRCLHDEHDKRGGSWHWPEHVE
jgi:hypothetical protein